MKTLKEYTKKFIHDESGMEIMQAVGILILSIALLGVLFGIGSMLKGKMEDAESKLSRDFSGLGI